MKYLLFIILSISFSAYAQDKTECTVTKIVDGDTFYCDTSSGSEKIRLIGVNTPEMKTEEGVKARDFASTIISIDQVVMLELDVQPRGPYRRLLAYVYLQDGTMFNQLLVEQGIAQVATYPPNVKYQDVFIAAQKQAQKKTKKDFGRIDMKDEYKKELELIIKQREESMSAYWKNQDNADKIILNALNAFASLKKELEEYGRSVKVNYADNKKENPKTAQLEVRYKDLIEIIYAIIVDYDKQSIAAKPVLLDEQNNIIEDTYTWPIKDDNLISSDAIIQQFISYYEPSI